jgi:hypothetical protein
MDDTVREIEAPSQAATAVGDDLPKAAHMGEDGIHWEVIGHVGNAHVHDGVGGLPPIDEDATTSGPRDTLLEAGEDGGGDVGRAEGDTNQLGDGVREAPQQIGDGDPDVVQ